MHSNSTSLEAKTGSAVLVTGASRGIGFEIARLLLQSGFRVILSARNRKKLSEAAISLSSKNVIHSLAADLTRPKEIEKLAEAIPAPLFGIVHNAGTWREQALDEVTRSHIDDLFALNVRAVALLTKHLLPKLSRGGRIVVIGSQLSTRGRAGLSIYSATKHAVLGLVRSWCDELRNRGICVNCVSPGWVDTASNRRDFERVAASTGQSFEQVLASVAMQCGLLRLIAPQEVASLVIFLLSNEGSAITGQNYEIR